MAVKLVPAVPCTTNSSSGPSGTPDTCWGVPITPLSDVAPGYATDVDTALLTGGEPVSVVTRLGRHCLPSTLGDLLRHRPNSGADVVSQYVPPPHRPSSRWQYCPPAQWSSVRHSTHFVAGAAFPPGPATSRSTHVEKRRALALADRLACPALGLASAVQAR